MQASRRDIGRTAHWGVAICIAAACAAVIIVILLAERGTFTRAPIGASTLTIPGITIDDDDGSAPRMPIVTSLRSDSQAERLGIRVGDHIAAVDGQSVRDVAGVRAAMITDRGRGPVALHILRGSAVRTIAIDCAGSAVDDRAGVNGRHGAQDPAD
jgi:S1-C subfamily serine protease